ncbi:MAG: hypothetical protein OTI34_17330 [Lewinella sp.]|nr:hypothetical protein [Lewinella sp.]
MSIPPEVKNILKVREKNLPPAREDKDRDRLRDIIIVSVTILRSCLRSERFRLRIKSPGWSS